MGRGNLTGNDQTRVVQLGKLRGVRPSKAPVEGSAENDNDDTTPLDIAEAENRAPAQLKLQ